MKSPSASQTHLESKIILAINEGKDKQEHENLNNPRSGAMRLQSAQGAGKKSTKEAKTVSVAAKRKMRPLSTAAVD